MKQTKNPCLLQVHDVGKRYGSFTALEGIDAHVDAGEVLCVLGDNGAGKSTFIKILAGAHPPTHGTLKVNGEERRYSNPREALDDGISTVYQDLAVVPLMPVWRNFFLGAELKVGRRPLRRLDIRAMKQIAHDELTHMGVLIHDIDQPIGTLSGGQRQSVAIARAVYLGAKLIILDEPTSALGVKQASVVLKYIIQARDRGVAVVFITHNPQHAHPIGDRFLILNRGESAGCFEKPDITIEDMTKLMAGGAELAILAEELERSAS